MKFNFQLNECSWCKSIFKLYEGIKCGPHVPLNVVSYLLSNNIAVVKHYRTKCLEDYIKQKCINRNAINAPFTSGNIIKTYFLFNNINLEKLMWSIKLCKQNNIQITQSDRMWLLNQFEIYCPITIVIRTHNRIDLLKNLLETLKQLKYKCKILVLDDGSIDNTASLLSSYNVDYVSLKNSVGPGEILARGRHLITTPYYIILDDDDLWNSNNVIEYFYNMIIDNPDSDLIQTKCEIARHVYGLVSTNLLLLCPILSMYRHDDYYYYWIESHAKNVVNVDYKFYNYRRELEGVQHVDNMESNLEKIARNFFKKCNNTYIKYEIKNKYHKYTRQERKVCDQMLDYINSLN